MEKRPDLAEMFREHELRVFTYLLRMVNERETAADLTQETFLRAFRVADRFRGDSSVSTWLLGISRKVFLEWLRKQRTPVAQSGATGGDPASSDSVDIQRALDSLEPEHREVLVLRFVVDLPGEDVAHILGVSNDVVRKRTERAKDSFRKKWDR